MKTHALVFASVVGCAVACASGAQEPSTPAAEPITTGAPSAVPAEVVAPGSWAEATTTELKVAFMKAKVVPTMAPIFKGYDATEYADFGCQTCHGADHKEPTEFLPELTLKDGHLTSFEEEPAVSKFMAEQVVGPMAQVLGLPPYDPETHAGFGCGGCHAIAMAP